MAKHKNESIALDPRERLVLDGLYDQSYSQKMSDREAERLWQLHQLYRETFDAACEAFVSARGHDKAALSDEQWDDIVAEVDDLARQWNEAQVLGPWCHLVTPLTTYLKRYYELNEEILDIRDEIETR